MAGRDTLVMCDQLATVDIARLSESCGFRIGAEFQRVDGALALVLDL